MLCSELSIGPHISQESGGKKSLAALESYRIKCQNRWVCVGKVENNVDSASTESDVPSRIRALLQLTPEY